MKRLVVAVLLLASCGGGQTALEQADEACRVNSGFGIDIDPDTGKVDVSSSSSPLPDVPWAEIGDGGDTLIVDGPAEEADDFSSAIGYIGCVFDEADVPDHVRSRMETTTSLSGQQQASWEGMEASWSFHPDSGFDVTLHIVE